MPERLWARVAHRVGKEKNPLPFTGVLPFTATPAIILNQIGEENDSYNHKIRSYLSATESRYINARATVETAIVIFF